MKRYLEIIMNCLLAGFLLPAWLLAAVIWRYSHGRWVFVSLYDYAAHTKHLLTLGIASFIWLVLGLAVIVILR